MVSRSRTWSALLVASLFLLGVHTAFAAIDPFAVSLRIRQATAVRLLSHDAGADSGVSLPEGSRLLGLVEVSAADGLPDVDIVRGGTHLTVTPQSADSDGTRGVARFAVSAPDADGPLAREAPLVQVLYQ